MESHDTPDHVRQQCDQFCKTFDNLRSEVGKVIVGHREVIDAVLISLFAGGNVLLEGVPGLGKTLLVRTLAESLHLPFSRIQFTPDLMPADVIGTNIVMEDPETGRRRFDFQRGPIFAQIVLADEINRATPKTQSALLEAMQERSVTVGGETYQLDKPFFVLATQNPIEQEGTYPLPEAQLDRFIFKINVGYSQLDDLMTILDRTTGSESPSAQQILDGPSILEAQTLIRNAIVAPHVQQYAARLTLATHPEGEHAVNATNKYVRCGASPRAAQALLLGGKVRAVTEGRFNVSYKDIQSVALLALRHRVLLNFEAEADRIDSDDVVQQILEATPTEPLPCEYWLMLKTSNIKRPESIDDLLDAELMARIGQLDVSSRKIFSGKLKGERRSKRRGESVEFADHRPYVSGDDIRHIDWNVFGRLDMLFLKLFLEEEDLSLHIVVDASASQDCGEPSKFLFQQKVATALAYIGLVNLNRVAITAIGDVEGGIIGNVRDLRGRRRLQDVTRFVCSLEPEGVAHFTDAAKRIALMRRGKGVMIVLSDFFIKEGYETFLRLLVGHGYDLFAIQVLSPQEMDPSMGGDMRLKDIEDGDQAEVTISSPLLKRYKANLNAYCNRLHDFCVRRDIVHMTVESNTPIDALLLDYLRKRGLLRR